MSEPLLIRVAGPYRSGTGDDPARIAANHAAIRRACLELFRAGHLPVNGEDLALPLAELAGSRSVGDAAFDEVFHPMGRRLVARVDGVLRLPGATPDRTRWWSWPGPAGRRCGPTSPTSRPQGRRRLLPRPC